MRLRPSIVRVFPLSLLVLPPGCVAEYSASRDPDVETETADDDDAADDDDDDVVGDDDDDGVSESEGLECDDFDLFCDGECIDPGRDDEHCGDCFEQCDDGTTCVEGNCRRLCDGGCDEPREVCGGVVCVCAPGLTACDGVCVDLDTDPEHCGSCDRSCGDDVACGGAACRPEGCDAFPNACDLSCTNTENDPLHCGECFEQCEPGTTCAGGECLPYHTLPGDVCGQCPCEEVCDPETSACCYWAALDHEICLPGDVCL